MSVKVHEAFSIDSFQDRLLWWDDFLGDQLKDEWRETGTGSAAVIDLQTGGIVRITTGAITFNSYLIDWGDIRSLLITKKVAMEARVRILNTANMNAQISLQFNGANRVEFTESLGSWNIHCEDNNIDSLFASGIALDTNWHIFRIECFPTDEVHFFIDGVETANSPITTNIPPDYLQPFFFIETVENVAKSMDIDYVVVRQEV